MAFQGVTIKRPEVEKLDLLNWEGISVEYTCTILDKKINSTTVVENSAIEQTAETDQLGKIESKTHWNFVHGQINKIKKNMKYNSRFEPQMSFQKNADAEVFQDHTPLIEPEVNVRTHERYPSKKRERKNHWDFVIDQINILSKQKKVEENNHLDREILLKQHNNTQILRENIPLRTKTKARIVQPNIPLINDLSDSRTHQETACIEKQKSQHLEMQENHWKFVNSQIDKIHKKRRVQENQLHINNPQISQHQIQQPLINANRNKPLKVMDKQIARQVKYKSVNVLKDNGTGSTGSYYPVNLQN